MEWNVIESGWNEYKGNAQRRWSKLTVEEVSATGGRREALSERVQAAYRLSPEKAEVQLADWQSRQHVIRARA
jgi:uncharacterized protein YjbJ (UPF0337 family)